MMKTFVRDYDKKVDFSVYAPGYHNALGRARGLARQAAEDEEPHRNPTTGVFLLTELIARYSTRDVGESS